MGATIADVILLSCCAFSGNIGAALTGFGQAIIFLFVWQIVELAGYHGDFKFAVFIQALSLFSMQPLLLYKAEVRKHAMRRVLLLFVPITLISTPLGQLTSDKVPTKTVQSVAGILVIFVSLWELYCKRHWILENVTKCCNTKAGATTKAANQDDAINKEDEEKDSSGTSNENYEENRINTENQPESTYHNESCEVRNPQTQNDADPENLHQGNNDQQQNIEETRQPNQQPQANEEMLKIGPNKATFYTLVAGGASGFLGGMVAIRGPPLIFYFLHPPHPIAFTKDSQRATGVVIMFFNVSVRMIFYLVDTFSANSKNEYFIKEDWRLYLSVIVCSIAGGWLGTKLFVYLKDSKDAIRGILSIFLLVCGVSLVISAFS